MGQFIQVVSESRYSSFTRCHKNYYYNTRKMKGNDIFHCRLSKKKNSFHLLCVRMLNVLFENMQKLWPGELKRTLKRWLVRLSYYLFELLKAHVDENSLHPLQMFLVLVVILISSFTFMNQTSIEVIRSILT